MNLRVGGPVWTVLLWYGYSEDDLLYTEVSLCKAFWSIVFGLVFLWPMRGIFGLLRVIGRILGRILNPVGDWLVGPEGSLAYPKASEVLAKLGVIAIPVAGAVTILVSRPHALEAVVITLSVAVIWFGMAGIAWVHEQRGRKQSADSLHRPKSSAVAEGVAIVAAFARAAKQRVCPLIRFED